MTTPQIPDAHIAEAAFLIWLDEGQPEGRDLDHWLAARSALESEAPKPKKRAASKPKAKAKAAAKTAKPKAEAKTKAPAKPRAPRKKAAAKAGEG